MTASTKLPAFTLTQQNGDRENGGGAERSFPNGEVTLLCFVHEECATCNLSMPQIEALHRAFSERVAVWVVGQDTPGNAKLIEEFGLTVPVLDDDTLGVSFADGFDTVPTLILADGEGDELRRVVGFAKSDWRDLTTELVRLTAFEEPAIDWDGLPDLRPGCGSRSVEPGIHERLVAEAEGSLLRARRIEIAERDDVAEFMFDQGLTDGLPVVPPTAERVLRMLEGTRRDAQDIVAVVPPNMAPATGEKVAINAVMAGCRPEYLPVVMAALEAVCTDEFNAHGVWATTMGAAPVLFVNGPIRNRIGMNSRLGALGQGNRANASIGRALRLVVRNVGGARPSGTERSTLGNSMKYAKAFAEAEERSPWEPYHVEHGFAPDDSVVTVIASTGEHLVTDQTSRTASQLAGSFGLALEGMHHPRGHGIGDVLFVISPEHVDTLWRDGWTKDDVRARIQEVTARPVRELLADEVSGAGIPARRFGPDGPTEEQLEQRIPKFGKPENIRIVVAGSDAGKFSQMYDGWAGGLIGSIPVSRKIEEV
jgi:hypothetical protein